MPNRRVVQGAARQSMSGLVLYRELKAAPVKSLDTGRLGIDRALALSLAARGYLLSPGPSCEGPVPRSLVVGSSEKTRGTWPQDKKECPQDGALVGKTSAVNTATI